MSRNAAFHALQPDLPPEMQSIILKRCEREGCWPDDILREYVHAAFKMPKFCPDCGHPMNKKGCE